MGSSHAAELRNVSLASLQQPASSTLMRAAEHFAPSTVTVGSRFLTDAHSTSVITAPVPTNSAIADNTVHTINSAFAETTPTYSTHNTVANSHLSTNAQIAPAANVTTTPILDTVPISTAQPTSSATAATTINSADTTTVQPPITASTNTASSADTTTSAVSVPTVVVKQLQLPKPYSGTSSWKSFREHFQRVARANNWTTDAKKSPAINSGTRGSCSCHIKRNR